jgi:hypothetical protein
MRHRCSLPILLLPSGEPSYAALPRNLARGCSLRRVARRFPMFANVGPRSGPNAASLRSRRADRQKRAVHDVDLHLSRSSCAELARITRPRAGSSSSRESSDARLQMGLNAQIRQLNCGSRVFRVAGQSCDVHPSLRFPDLSEVAVDISFLKRRLNGSCC